MAGKKWGFCLFSAKKTIPLVKIYEILTNLKQIRMKKLLHFSARLLLAIALCCSSLTVFAQKISVRGTVADESGAPLYGATVVILDNGVLVEGGGTTTNNNGEFTISVKAGQSLEVSFIGYKPSVVPITAQQTVYKVTLASDSKAMDEVVVVGYGSQKRVNMTGAVSSISAESFDQRPIISTSLALQGMAPGVTITSQSGAPGADGGSIRIRGVNSFGGSSTAPLVLIDGIEGDLDSIEPSDIDNISILKDAASASIYGSRAANGVILVQTKRAAKEKLSVQYKGMVSWQKPTDLPELVNAVEFRELTNAMNLNDGAGATYDDIEVYRQNMGKDPDLYPNTNWQDVILQGSGFMHQHSVSLSANTDRIKMRAMFGYSNRDGIINTSSFTRYNFRNNMDVKLNKKMTLKLDLAFSNSDRISNPYQSTIFNYMNTRPADIPCYFSTGLLNGLGMMGNNPVALMNEGGWNKNNHIRMNGAATLVYKPTKWLTLQGMVAPRYITNNAHNWKRSVTTYQDPEGTAVLTSQPFHTLTESARRTFYGNYNFVATVDKDFGNHNLKVMLGTERNTYDTKYVSAYRENFNYDYDQITAGEIANMDNSGYQYQWVVQSFFGRVNYNYKELYLFEANLRIDGSSRFIKKNRWGYFPSVSAAWRISEEPWMESAKDVLDALKIRASYGTLGSQNLAGSSDAASYYPFSQNLAVGNIAMGGNIYPIVTLNTMANEDIRWETTTVLDLGIDATLWGKLNITADWYQKHTDGILMTLNLPLGNGVNAPYQNAGKVKNTGWEVGIGYNDRWGDWTFGVNANVSDVVNTITHMEVPDTDGVLRNEQGHSIASIYALESMGIIRTQEEADWVNANCPQFSETMQIGDIRYKDINEDGKITTDDRTIVGNTIPRYTYSATLNAGWKGLNLSVMLQGVGLAYGYLNTYYVQPSRQGGTFRKEHLNHANADNPNGTTPRLTALGTNNWQDSSFWMKSAAYLRLKNVTLSYTLPKHIVKKAHMQGVTVYVSGENLLTFTNFWDGYDPEIGYGGGSGDKFDTAKLGNANSYPQIKTVTVGLDVKF